METLYNEKQAITFRYQVNVGGELNIAVAPSEREVEIVFEDGRFARCKFNFHGCYTRAHWHVLRGIADKITEIESRLKTSATA